MGSGGVAIAALPTVICLEVPFSDGLGGGLFPHNLLLERDAVVGGDTHDVDACGEA